MTPGYGLDSSTSSTKMGPINRRGPLGTPGESLIGIEPEMTQVILQTKLGPIWRKQIGPVF